MPLSRYQQISQSSVISQSVQAAGYGRPLPSLDFERLDPGESITSDTFDGMGQSKFERVLIHRDDFSRYPSRVVSQELSVLGLQAPCVTDAVSTQLQFDQPLNRTPGR